MLGVREWIVHREVTEFHGTGQLLVDAPARVVIAVPMVSRTAGRAQGVGEKMGRD